MKSGLKKIRKDHRDYDHHKNFGSVTFDAATLPSDFTVDAGISMPNQEEENSDFNIPALPFGCTGYTQTELCTDEDNQLYNPRYTYDKTLEEEGIIGENSGCDIRDSLNSVCNDGLQIQTGEIGNKRTAYFNVKAQGFLDWFDSFRVAIFLNQVEKRSISVGTPWYQEWSQPQNGILPTPADINNIRFASWHNYKVAGWKTINGIPYLLVKAWQGKKYGDNGWVYMSREIVNSIMTISGTGAFTVSRIVTSSNPVRISMNIWDTIISFLRNLLGI